MSGLTGVLTKEQLAGLQAGIPTGDYSRIEQAIASNPASKVVSAAANLQRDQGAIGNGVADDSVAILAWAGKAGQGLLFADKPSVGYYFTQNIAFASNTAFQGVGYASLSGAGNRNGSIFIKHGAFDGFTFHGPLTADGFDLFGDTGNTGDGMYLPDAGRSGFSNFSSTDHGGVGCRTGGKTVGLNANTGRMYNGYLMGNGSHGAYWHDVSTTGQGGPNCNAWIILGLELQGNGGEGLRCENSADCEWHEIHGQTNVSYGVHLVFTGATLFASGHNFWAPYLEADGGASEGLIDNGCTQITVWIAARSGVGNDSWVNNDTSGTNLIFGRISKSTNWYWKGTVDFQSWRVGDPTLAGYWQAIMNASTRALEYHFQGSGATPLDVSWIGDSSNVIRHTLGQLAIGAGPFIKGNLRGQGTVTFSSIAAGATQDQTLTVTGAAVGDDCFACPMTNTLQAGLVWSAFVSAANTVTIRVANVTTGAITPVAIGWGAEVWQH